MEGKTYIYYVYINGFPPHGVTGVGMDGLKAQPARSLPLPVTGAEMNEEETMARGRAKDKRLLVGCEMPPLYHTPTRRDL